MRIFKKYFFIIILCCIFSVILSEEGYGWWRRRKKPIAPKVRQKRLTYKYVRSHDVNNDGKVNLKDRLIWLRNRKGNYGNVYLSEENADLVEVMDTNLNGKVETWEMTAFYQQYDTNKNGILEDAEIEVATDEYIE